MSTIDWLVLLLTLIFIIAYGLLKGRKQNGSYTYLLAERQMPWYIVLSGIMATQASAITFLSAPGQAYTDGMRFVQYYFGLPVAMVVICVTFIPIFRKLNVYTAYEYLEKRFDKKTRLLTASLFLLSRGLSTGISIYAPAIIFSSILNINIYAANLITGGLLVIYTYTGGAKAVAHTQKLQFLIIISAMAWAGYEVVHRLPAGVGMTDALYLAGKAGKLNVITTAFTWKDKYNLWSGLIGGFFLALSYFGTDQSQVGRYLTAKNDNEGKSGLLLNGIVKIPMQFLILLLGTLVFVFYSYSPAPVNFNNVATEKFSQAEPAAAMEINKRYEALRAANMRSAAELTSLRRSGAASRLADNETSYKGTCEEIRKFRDSVSVMLSAKKYSADKNDVNYIFLYFVRHSLPVGVVGLLFAVIILASWGSISAALNSLAASSLMDIHLHKKKYNSPERELALGRWHTLGWGIFCILIAMFAARLGSLIEAVNILGSLFYGTILGIFLVAFYIKRIGGGVVFTAAIITEIVVISVYYCDIVSFLWLNVIGAMLVVIISFVLLFCRVGGKNLTN
ncbi:MAG: sodium:solute symporter [Taibaiella sp.]|nr:sodium:solute symporter [Taibaiella sp.]